MNTVIVTAVGVGYRSVTWPARGKVPRSGWPGYTLYTTKEGHAASGSRPIKVNPDARYKMFMPYFPEPAEGLEYGGKKCTNTAFHYSASCTCSSVWS